MSALRAAMTPELHRRQARSSSLASLNSTILSIRPSASAMTRP